MKKIFAAAALIALLTLSAGKTFAANQFSDVPAGHWAYDSVRSLERAGIATGFEDNTFRGNRNALRFEVATMLNNFWNKYFQSSTATTNPFSDIPPGHSAYEAVKNLANLGIATGYDDGTYRGNRNITRYELAGMLANFLIKANKISAPQNPGEYFSDVPKGNPNFDSVAIVTEADIMSGYGDGTFRGNRNITRYEVALILAKVNAKYFSK